ncbi:MAG: hypothetical protein NVS4B9_23850 [Ktedonobacteraceae bacterium]
MQSFTLGVQTIDPNVIMQRADDIHTIQRMLTDAQTSSVLLMGDPGVGKSTLASLIYHRLLLAKQAGMSAPRYIVWVSIQNYTTLSDIVATILQSVEVKEPGLFLLKPEQQITLLLRALQRQQDNALVVLDQFELLLQPQTKGNNEAQNEVHKALPLFLNMLQADLGTSRFLFTAQAPLFDPETGEQTRIRTYLVSRISIPEGVALLHQHGVKGNPEELSLVWQRCGGHVFALLLFSALVEVSGIAPGYLLFSPEYQKLWSNEILGALLSILCQYLNPIQKQVLRALSLFDEPVPLQAIAMTITGVNDATSADGSQSYAKIGREFYTLTHFSLVQSVQDAAQKTAFSLHPVIRQFVQEHYLEGAGRQLGNGAKATLGVSGPLDQLHDNPEAWHIALAAGHTQVAQYYYMLAQQQCPPKEQRTQVQDVAPFISVIRHLCLGWHWQQACDLLFKEGLHESLERWGAWNTLLELYTALLPPVGVLTRRDEGLLSSHVAMLYGRMGELQQSQAYFEQALRIQHDIEDTHGEAVTLANQGELCRIRGEREQAHINFEKAILLSRQQRDQQSQQEIHLQCIVLHNMGLLYHDAKDYAPALTCYIHALRLTYKLQEQHDKGTILTNLGMLLYQQGQQREGIAVLLAALQLRKALLDPSVVLLERFFIALEQRIGSNAYTQLCRSALGTQQQIFAHLMQTPE